MYLVMSTQGKVLQKNQSTMENKLNIATWNLCLGIANKKDTVTSYLTKNNIHVCCLQETEVPVGFPENLLNCGGFNLELEQNTSKKRAGIYLRSHVNYVRRLDLEKEDHHIVVVDVETVVPFRVISTYHYIC